jgi:hypothetical protein
MLLPLVLVILQSAASSSAWSRDSIATRCPEFRRDDARAKITACRVTQSGDIGTVGGDQYVYAFYCVEEPGFEFAGSCDDPDSLYGRRPRANVAVFVRERTDGTFRFITSQLGMDGAHRVPRIAATPFGLVMELGLVLAVSCDCNSSSYYLQPPGTREWRFIDWHAWQQGLHKRLPPGLTNMNDFWPDLQNLTTVGALWRRGDAHCCPTGGSVSVRLSIAKDPFVLLSFEVSHPSR